MSEYQVIPDAAVEASARVSLELATPGFPWADLTPEASARFLASSRAILEAAAPHMLKDLRELLEDMDAQPSSEIATVKGMAFLVRNTMKGLL